MLPLKKASPLSQVVVVVVQEEEKEEQQEQEEPPLNALTARNIWVRWMDCFGI